MSDSVVEISNLTVVYASPAGRTVAANDVSLSIRPRETVALVGGSGSGKSTIGRAAIGLFPSASRGSTSGCVTLFGVSAMDASRHKEIRRARLSRVGYVPQEPHASLNPLMRVRTQVLERGFASQNAVRLLQDLGIDHPGRILDSFAHALSGGEAQRAALARALAVSKRLPETGESHDGRLLVLDEPTAALDPVAKLDLLVKLQELKDSGGWSTLLITHDLEAAGALADRILVIEHGHISDQLDGKEPALVPSRASGLVERMDSRPKGHASIGSSVGVTTSRRAPDLAEEAGTAVLSLDSVSFVHPLARNERRGSARGIFDVSLSIRGRSCIGLLGASGSGKTTLLRLAGGWLTPDVGEVRWTDSVAPQLVPQDFGASFTPWLRVGNQIAEFLPSAERRVRKREVVASLLRDVGLRPELANSRPDEMSGGQKQRAAIARALAAEPTVLLLDEPTAALDSNSARQLAELLSRLRMRRGVTVILASHDLSLIRAACETLVVLQNGRVVESGGVPDILRKPASHATSRLVDSTQALRHGRWAAPISR